MVTTSESTSYRPRQLAVRWGLHEESIRRMIREGRLPAMRIGRRLRVTDNSVLAFEEAHQIQGPNPDRTSRNDG